MIRLRRRVLRRLMSIVRRERRKHEGFEASLALDRSIEDQHIFDQRESEIMIKHFSVLYVGHIELENVGIDGTPADTRRYPNERVIEAFRMATDVAKEMDRHDFYALWMAEHHFQHEGYECIPNLILLGTYLATQTQHLKFGCAFNVVPMWHPIRLAEDFAMADILTGGRVIFGVGRGYHTREVETFGAPMLDNNANKEFFEEQMEIILKCFNEDSFSHQGKHYTIPAPVPYRGYDLKEITVVPRPIHQPVEIWQPIVSGRTLEYVAKMGIKGVVGLTGEKLLDQRHGAAHQLGLVGQRGAHVHVQQHGPAVGLFLDVDLDPGQVAVAQLQLEDLPAGRVDPLADDRERLVAADADRLGRRGQDGVHRASFS